MKIVTYMGSPRRNGCTATVLGWVEEELCALGHEVERVIIVDHEIHGCISCYKCQEVTDELGCVFKEKDDAVALWNKAIDSDLIIFASPLYCWGFTSQMKAFVDRSFAIVKTNSPAGRKSLIAGRKVALLMTCEGPIEGNADLMIPVFSRLADYKKTINAGHLIVPGCTTPDALGDDVKASTTAFAKEIVGT